MLPLVHRARDVVPVERSSLLPLVVVVLDRVSEVVTVAINKWHALDPAIDRLDNTDEGVAIIIHGQEVALTCVGVSGLDAEPELDGDRVVAPTIIDDAVREVG